MGVPLNIDWQQILLHLFNFVLLAGGLYFLLYAPVRNFMERRTGDIAAKEKAAAEKAAAEKAAAEKAAAEKARAQSQAAATGERRVTLSTSGACWVQILLPNGRSFFAKEMAEGGSETLNVPVGARVTVGNASVMTLTVDGRPYELTKSTRNGICRFVVK